MPSNSNNFREFNNLRIDLDKKVVWYADEPVQLPVKAVEVLCELVEKPGEVVTKDELLAKVWHDSFVEENVLAQSIHHLRRAFRELNLPENTIQTIPRRGYRFAGEIRESATEILYEHEIVERSLLAEVDEDSGPHTNLETVPAIARTQRRSLAVSLCLLIGTALLIGFGVWWTTSSSNGVAAEETARSIAVLPLKPLNASEKSRIFSLGLTDSLISRLGKLNKFPVRPFSAVEKYADSEKDGLTFGRELKADSVLEGTIQQADGRVRVSLKLFDVRTGVHLWSDDFDEPESDILKLQDKISNRVARVLLPKLQPQDEHLLARKPTANTDAYLLYIAGRERWLQRNGKAECLAFYQKAIELDPNFALPFLGIADEYAFTYETKKAEDALAKAIELDPELAEAHATRGFLQMFHHWNWQGAERSFSRALELAPNSSKAHHWYGVYLSIQGRIDEALREMQRALELDPSALVIMTDIAELYYFNHEYERAEVELEKVLDIDPKFLNARERLVKVRHKKGGSYFLEDAQFSMFFQNLRKSEGLTHDFDTKALARALERKDEETLKGAAIAGAHAAKTFQPAAHLALARLYAISGEKTKAIDSLEGALAGRVFVMPFVAVDPLFDPLRSEPRFKDIIRRMNL